MRFQLLNVEFECGYVVGIESVNVYEFHMFCSVHRVKDLSSSIYNAAILPRPTDRPFSTLTVAKDVCKGERHVEIKPIRMLQSTILSGYAGLM